MISFVSPAETLTEWSEFEPQIQRVIDLVQSGSTTEDILTCLQQGRMQLWRVSDGRGIGITEIQIYPRYRTLLVYMVAGRDVQDWAAQGQQQLEQFARDIGCKYLEFVGRPGWEKLAKARGFTDKFIRMRKEI